MPSSVTAEAIVFAINSAVRLGRNIQKAYANSLRSRAIVLPLPSFDENISPFTIRRFFDSDGAHFVTELEVLKYLHLKNNHQNLEGEELEEYRYYYRTLYRMYKNGANETAIREPNINIDDIVGLLKIRQWETKNEFATSTLQLVAGTVVEIGIDYFNQFPGAINEASAMGLALKKFLSAIDNIKFSEAENFKQLISKKIIPRLFITASETLHELSTEIVRDEKLQQFVAAVSKGITDDLYARIGPNMTLDEQDEAISWGQMVLSSMIRNAGYYVFSDPTAMLNVNQGQNMLIKNTGLVLMDLLFSEDELKIDLKQVLQYESLDLIFKTAFSVFAEYPELLSKEKKFRILITEISLALVESGINKPELLPELIRLVVEKTAENLYSVWDLEETDTRNLLVLSMKEVLAELSKYNQNTEEAWQLHLSKTQLLDIIYNVFDEVVKHPIWITQHIEESPLLARVMATSLEALTKVPREARLNFQTFQILLELNMQVVASSPEVLEKIKWSDDESEKILLQLVLDYVFEYVFNTTPVSNIHKTEVLRNLLSYVLDQIIAQHPNDKGFLLVQMILDPELGINFNKRNTGLQLIEELGEILLSFLAIHPEMFSREAKVQDLFVDIIQTVRQYGINQEGIFREIIRITFEKLAQHLDRLILSHTGQAKHLLVIALEQILSSLSKDRPGQWNPKLSSGQLIFLLEQLFDEVINHPDWILKGVNEETLINDALEVSFRALQVIPNANRLTLDTFLELLELNMHSIASNKKVLERIKWSDDKEEEIILHSAVELIFDYVFNKDVSQLDRTRLGMDILEYVLRVIISKHPTVLGLRVLEYLLYRSGIDLTDGVDEMEVDLLISALLNVLAEQAEIFSSSHDVQAVITKVATALEQTGIDHPNLLAEVLRMMLIETTVDLELLFKVEDDELKRIMIDALRQILKALTEAPSEGCWKPYFSDDQLIEIVLYILNEVEDHTEWGREMKIYSTLEAIFKALEFVPKSLALSFSNIKLILIKVFEAVRNNAEFLAAIGSTAVDEATIAIKYILTELFKLLYQEISSIEAIAIIQQPSVIDALLDYYLFRLSNDGVNKDRVDAIIQQLMPLIGELDAGIISNSDEFIDYLRQELS